MTKADDKSDKLILVVGTDTIRIKKNNFIKKWFSRHYRTDKSIKELAKAGYEVGSHEFKVDSFIDMVEDNLTSHRKSIVKKAKKAYKSGDESITIGRNTKRDRRVIKRKLSKDNDLDGVSIVKDKDNIKDILFVAKAENLEQKLIENAGW